MKITIEGDHDEMKRVLSRLFEPVGEAKVFAEQAAASAAKADTAARNAEMAVKGRNEI